MSSGESHAGKINFPFPNESTALRMILNHLHLFPVVDPQMGIRADSRFAPSQWNTVLLCNAVSHWLGTKLESALYNDILELPLTPDSSTIVCDQYLQSLIRQVFANYFLIVFFLLQTPCGHLVCRGCLERLWREWDGPVPCPGQQDYCDMLTTDNVSTVARSRTTLV